VSMRIALGADHAGFELKRELVEGLRDLKYTVDDLGTFSAEPFDYPDVAHKAAQGVASGVFERAILIDGTGVGVAIVANRYRGVRAANCTDIFSARFSRQHNDSNVLCLGGRVVGVGLAWELVNVWLSTPFSGEERLLRRLAKIDSQ
jgi:ribose 5-phosphate isomerase B